MAEESMPVLDLLRKGGVFPHLKCYRAWYGSLI
jgi:hypothetical protein